MAQITMTISAHVYGRQLAYWLMWAMSWLGFSERTIIRAGLCVTFTQLRMGGKHVSWHWLGRIDHAADDL